MTSFCCRTGVNPAQRSHFSKKCWVTRTVHTCSECLEAWPTPRSSHKSSTALSTHPWTQSLNARFGELLSFNILFTAFVQWWSSSNILSSYITLNEPWFDMYRNMLVLRHICFAILTNVGFVVSHEHWCYTIKLFLENKDFYICKICFL